MEEKCTIADYKAYLAGATLEITGLSLFHAGARDGADILTVIGFTVGVLGVGLWLGALVGSLLRYRRNRREGGE